MFMRKLQFPLSLIVCYPVRSVLYVFSHRWY